jgi:tetratricopeptide (TPR) repeat protein
MKQFVSTAVFLAFAAIALAATPNNEVSPADLIHAGHFKRARLIVETSLQKNSKDAQALYCMSRIKLAFGDADSAISLAEQAIAIDGSKAEYHFALGQAMGSKAQKASMFSGMRMAHTIKKEAELAVQMDPKFVDGYSLLIGFHLNAPGIAGGDKKKARELADKLLTFDQVQGNLAYARIAAADNQKDQLESFYLKAVQANPKDYEAQVTLGNYYANQKKYELTEKSAREALKLQPTHYGGYTLLAFLYATQERWSDLDTILAEAEKNVPDDLSPTFQAGRTLLIDGKDLPRAERYFRKYLTREPEGSRATLAHAHWRLGLVLEKQGRKPEAINEIQTAVNLKPDLEDAKKDLKRLK